MARLWALALALLVGNASSLMAGSARKLPSTRRLGATSASSRAMDMVTPVTIVGANGRVGDLLASVGEGKDVLVGRSDSIPEDGEGPILVCTRNDVLDSVRAWALGGLVGLGLAAEAAVSLLRCPPSHAVACHAMPYHATPCTP